MLINYRFFTGKAFRRKREKESLRYLSYHDLLTGLYNRNRLLGTLERFKGQQRRRVAAAYIDLNDLKMINDRSGHAAGDALLKNTGRILSEMFPQMAYRAGGDEFVLLVWDMDKCTFERKIKRLQQAMEGEGISISVGTAWQEAAEDPALLLNEADRSMYEMKKKYHQNKEQMDGIIIG